MTGWKTIAIAVALTGCAGVQTTRQTEFASGHWAGELDRGGWHQAVSLDLERDGAAWRGEWLPASEHVAQPLENVELQGRELRFDTGTLRFVGSVDGARLSGTVTDGAANVPVGELSATKQPEFFPSPEWGPPTLP
jgi:hypothetical protein